MSFRTFREGISATKMLTAFARATTPASNVKQFEMKRQSYREAKASFDALEDPPCAVAHHQQSLFWQVITRIAVFLPIFATRHFRPRFAAHEHWDALGLLRSWKEMKRMVGPAKIKRANVVPADA